MILFGGSLYVKVIHLYLIGTPFNMQIINLCCELRENSFAKIPQTFWLRKKQAEIEHQHFFQ